MIIATKTAAKRSQKTQTVAAPPARPPQELPAWAKKLAAATWDDIPQDAVTVATFAASVGMPYQMASTTLRKAARKGSLKVAQRHKMNYYWPA